MNRALLEIFSSRKPREHKISSSSTEWGNSHESTPVQDI